MYSMYLRTIEDAIKLSNLCNKYAKTSAVDVSSGRYVVDGASLLGLAGLIGSVIKVDYKDPNTREKFFAELSQVMGKINEKRVRD